MTQHRRTRLPAEPPTIAPPPPSVERRVEFRRAADRLAHEETLLLTRALDVLARRSSAEERLAGMLDLLARTTGSRRAAVVANGQDRRVAVSIAAAENPAQAASLAAWLDAQAPRSRAERAASGPAPVSFAISRELPRPGASAIGHISDLHGEPETTHYTMLRVPGVEHVLLGFDFADAAAAAQVGERLTPNLARHAAVALALVTDQLAREREVAELRARETERARFVPTVAHELRTPLTGLQGYLDLILSGTVGDPRDMREFLERSREIVESMSGLVGDLLEFARLESGSLQLEIRPFSVAEVAQRALASIAPMAAARELSVKSDLPPRLRVATGDRRRVEQILVNLVANALKFTPVRGAIELSAWFDGPVSIVAVRDDGPGIAPADRNRIFERFYRTRGSERIGGTGLGLPIARELARAMGGALDVVSIVGSGSSFVLALPVSSAADRTVIATVLARSMGVEAVRLEEHSILRLAQTVATGSQVAASTPAPIALPTTRRRRPKLGGSTAPASRSSLVPDAHADLRLAGRSERLRVLSHLVAPTAPLQLRALDGLELTGDFHPDDPSTA